MGFFSHWFSYGKIEPPPPRKKSMEDDPIGARLEYLYCFHGGSLQSLLWAIAELVRHTPQHEGMYGHHTLKLSNMAAVRTLYTMYRVRRQHVGS